jgi:hypothetical protein
MLTPESFLGDGRNDAEVEAAKIGEKQRGVKTEEDEEVLDIETSTALLVRWLPCSSPIDSTILMKCKCR